MKIRRLCTTTCFALTASFGLVLPGEAATATGSFQVNATVVSACTISAATLSFGSTINPISATVPINASTSMTVLCTSTTPYTVALNAGVNAGGSSNFSTRLMKNGSNTLGYQLYLDSLYSTVWGDGTASSSTLPGVGTGANQTLTIYGRLPSVSGAVPGAYTDTVTVTVSY